MDELGPGMDGTSGNLGYRAWENWSQIAGPSVFSPQIGLSCAAELESIIPQSPDRYLYRWA